MTSSLRTLRDRTRRRRGRHAAQPSGRTKTRVAAALTLALLAGSMGGIASPAAAAPVGQGFNVNVSDLRFILKQIKIAEQHAATATPGNPCGTLQGAGADQIPVGGVGVTLPWGLRTVDGSCNNLVPGQNGFGTADQDFPRLVPVNLHDAESGDPDGPGPAPAVPTSYAQTSGPVFDSQPRIISNLIVDQTAGNPAAVEAAGEDPEVDPDTGALFIPNVAPDTGLSAPYNSWFTLFGQFFDHGLDLVNKGGHDTVYVPLQPDDPQYVVGSPTNFMALTRATHDGTHEANNQTSPFVDQSQTYTSHPSHQVFLREYANDASGKPVATGGLITSPDGGMATWAVVKDQAETMLGIELVDTDALAVPIVRTDPYGRFLRGPNGYPLLVTGLGLDGVPNSSDDIVAEGDPVSPVGTAAAVRTGHAFLDDVAHHAVPGTYDHDHNPGTPNLVKSADADPGTTDDHIAGTYDDEMLDAHFIAGDGRVNENIGLTAVHHIFHSEHNRLTGAIKDTITNDDPTQLSEWQLPGGAWNGERIFQAARFVTEMQYQHLAFEEFARKVQPMVNLFGEGGTGYHTTINPAIRAEFAHAVYRFGHSMLTETLARTAPDGTDESLPLLDAFLDPTTFHNGKTPEEASGDIIRGMTRQVGNELDEFVTDGVRNNLLGLPLDLATLNMTRARETGVPSLNEARRAFYAESSDSALTPYESWADFGFNLKHDESLTNFIAAYGTHPFITAEPTVAGKRAAAAKVLAGPDGADGVRLDDPGTPEDEAADNGPEDSYAFINSVPHEPVDEFGTPLPGGHALWVSTAGGVTTTGVDAIDLWVGGLAEKQIVFGGLLGPTFNFVFEKQMEDLQDGDRFYYLSRTAGLNLLTQLEGNSFSELIQRNTDVEGLPADSFSRPDYIFNVAALGTTGPILNDPSTEYNESTLLTRSPDGTIRYAGESHVVFNGSAGNDRVRSSEGDDTFRGNDGDDRFEGGDGNDSHVGGLGDDILNDLAGDDVLKGGDGNDALSSGRGFGGDLNQGGRGNDFIVGGNDMTESFAGPGDDYVFAGESEDTVFGDDGDDWIEGGGGAFNLLQGDNGAPFQDDPNEPGHDVLMGYGGETDNDAEGGDDIMLAGPGIQRNEGMLGFDWVTHRSDPEPGDSDMRITGALPPSVDTNRDRHDLVESLSGWNLDDILRGDDRVAADMDGHELDQAGIDRISGLDAVLPGATSFTGGNILLGGAGSDLLEGRGGDDVLDGDKYLNVRISVRAANNPDVEILSANNLTEVRAAIFAGTIKPGQLRIIREILPTTPTVGQQDTALFSGARAEYTVTFNAGSITVAHTGGTGVDGIDTVHNVERLQFLDQVVSLTAPGAPTIGTATAGNASATVNWTAPASAGGSPITSYEVVVRTGTTVVSTITGVPANATSRVVTGLTNGTAYDFQVRAVNAIGASVLSAPSNAVTPFADTTAPTVSARSPLAGATGVPIGDNVTATFSEAVNGVTVARFTLRQGTAANGALVARAFTYDPVTRVATLNPNANLLPNTLYTVRLLAGITDTAGNALAPVSWNFTTAGAPGNVAPTVTARTPAVNATGVGRAANITATFSEAITGWSTASVQIQRVSNNAFVTSAVSINVAGTVVTLNPGANLAANVQYRVILTGGPTAIRDLAGAPLVTTTWTFTTGP
jgi:Ca2+-binding RTX toxin-like protein